MVEPLGSRGRLASEGPRGRVRTIREAAGLSVAEVAAAVGVDRVTVWKWERGDHPPAAAEGLRYADVLDALRRRPR